MEIKLAKHRGFCYGVKRAVDLAYECRGRDKVFTYGPIIHNPQLVDRLSEQGVKVTKTLEGLDDATIIIRSHGVKPEIYDEAKQRNITVIDATCPHVKKAQQSAKKLSEEGYTLVVIGEKDHPEVQGIVAWASSSTYVVETTEAAEQLSYIPRLGVVVQTTFSLKAFEEILAILATKCDELSVSKTICNATEMRQQAAVELASQVDVMLVVGGKNSANTTRLASLCKVECAKTYHIETVSELKEEWFKGINCVGITAGASTPEWLIEEVVRNMQEIDQMEVAFQKLEVGSIVDGTVISINGNEVFVDIGYKAEGIIPLTELAFPTPEDPAQVVEKGQVVSVYVLQVENNEGHVILSKIRADQIKAWETLNQAAEEQTQVSGKVIEAIKGGLVVAVNGLRGFVPASHIALQHVDDLTQFVGQEFVMLPIEVDKSRNKLVLSRREVLKAEVKAREEKIYASLKPGEIIEGTVRRIANFGAFIDIGGVDGLVHISDLSWQRVKNPAEVVSVGDKLQVKVLKVDPAAKRISLSLKDVQQDPWFDAIEELSQGMILKGKVTKIAKFGAFVKLKEGVEGLAHISELSDKRITNADEAVTIGQELTVEIINIDKKAKRIALSVKKAQEDMERREYQDYMSRQDDHQGATIGDLLGHLFKKED